MVSPRLPGQGGPISPYTYLSRDSTGKVISATFPFNTSTHALLDGAVAHRDVGCAYTQIVVGSPSAPAHTIDLRGFTGDKTFTAAQLAAVGLNALEDITSLQITAIAAP